MQSVTCGAWNELKKISAREGIIALAYERNPAHKGFSRLIQMSKNFLFAPSSGLYSCPLAMTDGAAKTLEVYSIVILFYVISNLFDRLLFLFNKVSGLKDHGDAYNNLTSRNPDKFWTSGQWMTEKRGITKTVSSRKRRNNFTDVMAVSTGGSDVAGGTETLAVQDKNSSNMYQLYGYKFFSSATDADIALTLARIVDPSTGKTTAVNLFQYYYNKLFLYSSFSRIRVLVDCHCFS